MLEIKPLYSRWKETLPEEHYELKGDSINMSCEICESNQTFNCFKVFFNGEDLAAKSRTKGLLSGAKFNPESINGSLLLRYLCAKCGKIIRTFILMIWEDGTMMKIGQFPAATCEIPKEISSLGDSTIGELYSKGKISENQAYGIGAFAYYRRVVEGCIDELIDSIESIIPIDKKQEYEELIKKVKKEKNAQKKIELVKDTIVDTAIQGNPFSKIYELSSIGLHQLSDAECLECAESLRDVLLYVVGETKHAKDKQEKLKTGLPAIEKMIKKYKKE